jgi:hypothetical protein
MAIVFYLDTIVTDIIKVLMDNFICLGEILQFSQYYI